jgi:hypothetical protein
MIGVETEKPIEGADFGGLDSDQGTGFSALFGSDRAGVFEINIAKELPAVAERNMLVAFGEQLPAFDLERAHFPIDDSNSPQLLDPVLARHLGRPQFQ